MRPPPNRSAAGAVALGTTGVVSCLLPTYLTGAMAVQLTSALGFGTVGLGAAVALNRAAPALASPLLGRLVDDLGATRAIRLAAGVSVVASLGIVFTARSWSTFVVWMMLAGLANALAQPGANRLLSNVVPPARLGIAFGVKQSAPPAGSMLAGLSVPIIALTIGWRWAFVATAVLALSIMLLARPTVPRSFRRARREGGARPRLADRGFLVALAFVFGLATAFSATTTTFYVAAAVSAATPPRLAGYVLAGASFVAIATRLLAGVACDRMPKGHLRLCAIMIGSACIGQTLLSSDAPALMAIGVVIALGGGWGFNGVFWYSLVRAYPNSPGQLTGAMAPGGLLGGTLGPLVFGVVADRFGYPTMWWATAVLAGVAAVGMWLASRRLPEPPIAR